MADHAGAAGRRSCARLHRPANRAPAARRLRPRRQFPVAAHVCAGADVSGRVSVRVGAEPALARQRLSHLRRDQRARVQRTGLQSVGDCRCDRHGGRLRGAASTHQLRAHPARHRREPRHGRGFGRRRAASLCGGVHHRRDTRHHGRRGAAAAAGGPVREAGDMTRAPAIVIALAGIIGLALLPLLAPSYYASLMIPFFGYAIALLGFNLLFGYTGLLSFGHAMFLGFGAYGAAVLAGVLGIKSFEAVLFAVMLLAALAAVPIGVLCMRYVGIFFGMLTLAFGMLVYWTQSGQLVFMAVLGGFSNFFGPIIGALAFTLLQDQLQSLTQYWRFILGAILALIVIAFPGGLAGLADDLRWRARKST